MTTDGNNYLQHSKDLHCLIEHFNLDKVTLLGWSLGVYDALAYIQQYGHDKVQRLILADESPKIIKDTEQDWGEGTVEEVKGLIDMINSKTYLPFFKDYMAAGFDTAPDDALLNQFTKLAASLSPEQAASLLEDAAHYDFKDLLIRLDHQLPIQFILREDWSTEAAAWINTNLPKSSINIKGGHLMLMEYPEQFNQWVKHFMHNSR